MEEQSSIAPKCMGEVKLKSIAKYSNVEKCLWYVYNQTETPPYAKITYPFGKMIPKNGPTVDRIVINLRHQTVMATNWKPL